MLLASHISRCFARFYWPFYSCSTPLKVWHILTLSFVVGRAILWRAAYSALLPALVGPEELSNAIAMNSIQFNIARVLGPIIGGLAYSTLGQRGVCSERALVSAVIASLFVITVKFVPANRRVRSCQPEGGSPIYQAPGRDERPGGAGILHGAVRVLDHQLLTGFRAQRFSKRSRNLHAAIGVLWSGIDMRGAGRGRSGETKGAGPFDALILILLGFASAGFALSRWLPLSCALMFLAGAAVMASASFMLSLAQLIATDEMRGRVMSVYDLAFRDACRRTAFGKLIPWLGVAKALGGGGLALVVVSLYSDQGRKHVPRGQGCGVIGSGTFANGGLNKSMGPAAAARAIEPLCMMWRIPGFEKNDWMRAFKMLLCHIGCRSLRLLTPIRCRDRDSYFATSAHCACFFWRLTFAQRFRCAAAIASRASVLNLRLAVLSVEVGFTALSSCHWNEASARARLEQGNGRIKVPDWTAVFLRSLCRRFPLVIVLQSLHAQ